MLYRVSVPASSANLGPGFDSFGLSLDLRNEFSAELADKWDVRFSGQGELELTADTSNQVARAMARVFAEAGCPERAAHVECVNRIPIGRGLGSSSAAIVGGIVLADALVSSDLGMERLFELAVELEGHPDNVAAAMFGGLTVCWIDDGPHAMQLEPGCGLAAVVAMSDVPLSTTAARAMLPAMVPHEDAAFNVARASLLLTGIIAGDETLVKIGLQDRLHEQYRAAVVPDLQAVKDALMAAGADGAALSGAGPSIIGLVLAEDDDAALERARAVAAAVKPLPGRSTLIALTVDRDGVSLL